MDVRISCEQRMPSFRQKKHTKEENENCGAAQTDGDVTSQLSGLRCFFDPL